MNMRSPKIELRNRKDNDRKMGWEIGLPLVSNGNGNAWAQAETWYE